MGIIFFFVFCLNDQIVVCDGKFGVVWDFDNEEWQDEINNGIVEILLKCIWYKFFVFFIWVDLVISGGVLVIRLMILEGSEYELVDLVYYLGLDWVDLNDEEGFQIVFGFGGIQE